ncbi:MAG: hypothetical protein SCH98_12520 [Deferrisomatales bacterium]|nr:hypothetical protein [Deferrisomatales bacterium]
MTTAKKFEKEVESLCWSASQGETGRASRTLEDLCSGLHSCCPSIPESEAGRWEGALRDVRRAYEDCSEPSEGRSMCGPFFEKAQGLIEQCRSC